MSSYAEQREREQKQAEENHVNLFVPLVNGIAAEFNGTVEFSERAYGWETSHAKIKTAEFELYCTAGGYEFKGTDRMAIGGSYKRHVSLHYGEKRQDRMTVTMRKSAAQVANDIRRRILEHVKNYTERLWDEESKEREAAALRDSMIERLKNVKVNDGYVGISTWVAGMGKEEPRPTDTVQVRISVGEKALCVSVRPGGYIEIPAQSTGLPNKAIKLIEAILDLGE